MKFILFLLLPMMSISYADSFYKIIGYDCNQKSDTIIFRYEGAYDEIGKSMLENKSETQWSLEEFIATMQDDDHIGTLSDVELQCQLQGETYIIKLGGKPGNYNIQGKCGAWMTAWVEVRKGKEQILPRYHFEYPNCHVEAPVTTKITIHTQTDRIDIRKILFNNFYSY